MSARTSIHCDKKVMASDLQPTAPSNFALFPKLPEELRCMIWARSAPLRPRVIQLFYEATSNTWHACPDSCGGLPPIIRVSQEARKEALKGYTWAFDTYIDLEDDTIFIGDPVFPLREPQKAFLNTEHARAMSKFAMSSGLHDGLEEVAAAYPTLCLGFPAVLRKLERLTHFTLVMSDNTQLTTWSYAIEHASDDGYHLTDEEDGGHESEAENITAIDPNQTPSGGSVANNASKSQRLARLEEDALECMSTGFFRERGKIHFEDARTSVAIENEWDGLMYCMADNYDKEKLTHPDWVRPNVSIMILRYGLNRLGEYGEPIHIAGDHGDTVLEQEIEVFDT